jgi:hypothetical protein
MSRTLSYADAVRLLGGGRDSPAVKLLERLTGGLLIAGAAAGGPALLAWLGARTEVARLGHDLVRRLSERRAGLSRLDRTRRLEAAHTVLVVTAFFEALAEAELPFRFAELELTRAEQLALAGAPGEAGEFIAQVQASGGSLPEPAAGQAAQLDLLRDYYANLAGRLVGFVTGLAVWERLPAAGQAEFRRALAGVPACAGRRYQELLRRLAADFPEVAFWAGLQQHRATQAEVGRVGAALAELGRMLEEISTGRAPDQRRQALARAYRKALERPVVAAGAVPGELRLPTLGDGYLAPRFRVQPVHFDVKLSDESCWQGWPVRADLQEFLIGQLTSGQATEAALLVLGQPGSGKSVLTRVLAAQLPAADFLPVRVVLRDVPATGSLQDQIEHAIRDATGERLDWPALVRSAGDALPVVILDGFDELLQATGVSQSDYLIRVADFQRREADQGRPVAVIVTSRTSVADRARVPEGAVALRLEPFDDERVTAWLALWNRLNAAGFWARKLAPLAVEAVLAHRELAQQPLLLLMLALYDADGNALQRGAAELSEYELYERLLGDFARREVTKHRPDLPDRDRDRAVEQELRRLSIVALGMVNRGSLWITESDLELDLRALLGRAPGGGRPTGAARPAAGGRDRAGPVLLRTPGAGHPGRRPAGDVRVPARHLRGVPGRPAHLAGAAGPGRPGGGRHAVAVRRPGGRRPAARGALVGGAEPAGAGHRVPLRPGRPAAGRRPGGDGRPAGPAVPGGAPAPIGPGVRRLPAAPAAGAGPARRVQRQPAAAHAVRGRVDPGRRAVRHRCRGGVPVAGRGDAVAFAAAFGRVGQPGGRDRAAPAVAGRAPGPAAGAGPGRLPAPDHRPVLDLRAAARAPVRDISGRAAGGDPAPADLPALPGR